MHRPASDPLVGIDEQLRRETARDFATLGVADLRLVRDLVGAFIRHDFNRGLRRAPRRPTARWYTLQFVEALAATAGRSACEQGRE